MSENVIWKKKSRLHMLNDRTYFFRLSHLEQSVINRFLLQLLISSYSDFIYSPGRVEIISDGTIDRKRSISRSGSSRKREARSSGTGCGYAESRNITRGKRNNVKSSILFGRNHSCELFLHHDVFLFVLHCAFAGTTITQWDISVAIRMRQVGRRSWSCVWLSRYEKVYTHIRFCFFFAVHFFTLNVLLQFLSARRAKNFTKTYTQGNSLCQQRQILCHLLYLVNRPHGSLNKVTLLTIKMSQKDLRGYARNVTLGIIH